MRHQIAAGFKVKLDDEWLAQKTIEDIEIAKYTDVVSGLDELRLTFDNYNFKYTRSAKSIKGMTIGFEGGWHGSDWAWFFTGKVSSVTQSGDPSKGDKLTVIALPIDLQTDGWTQPFNKVHIANRHSDIVKKIVSTWHKDYGTINIQETPLALEPLVVQQNDETDIDICRRVAQLAGGYEFAIKNKEVIFRLSTPNAKPVADLKFIHGKNIIRYSFTDTDKNQASSYGVAEEYERNNAGIEIAKMESEKHRQQENNVTVLTKAEMYRHDTELVRNIGEVLEDGYTFFHANPNDGDGLDIAKAALDAGVSQEITGEVTTEGNVFVRAGMTTEVIGVLGREGIYYINPKCMHIWDNAGYNTNCSLTNIQKKSSV